MIPFLSAASQTGQPDYVALAMVLVLAVIVAIMAVRKHFQRKEAARAAAQAAAQAAAAPVKAPAAAPTQAPKTAPGSAGRLKLHDVEPKTAAMLMAIVADKMGKPLSELRFISIKEVKKQ